MSLRSRLLLVFFLLSVSLVLGAASTASRASYTALINQVDERLYAVTTQVLEDETEFGETLDDDLGPTFARIDIDRNGDVTGTATSGLSSSPDPLPALPEDVLSLGREPFTVDAIDSSIQYRVTVVDREDNGVTVLAVSLEQIDTAMGNIGLALLFGGTLALLGAGALAAFFIRRETKKLDTLASTADAFAVGDFTTRAPVREDSSEVGRVVVALNSMLDRVEHSVTQEQAAKERLSAFIDDVSHELRTPVTTIHGYAELHEQGGLPADADVERAMRRIQQESGRMAILIEELVTLARLGMVRVPDVAPVDLTQLAQHVVADARITAPDRQIDVVTEPGITALGDRDRLQQAVINLVTNAIVHTPDEARIVVSVAAEGDHVAIEVYDDAGAIAPEALPHVFDRAWRGDSGGASHGLGLSIVKRIVEEHHGVVETSSDPATGTRFRMVLPAVPHDRVDEGRVQVGKANG